MTWRVPTTVSQAATVVNLGETDNVLVGIGVTLTTTGIQRGTIIGNGSYHDARIMGRVENTVTNTLSIGDDEADVGNRVAISQGE